RSPLTPQASPGRSFDLHVSCTPPAFILSQDQTLRRRRTRLAVCPSIVRGLARSHNDLSATLHLLRCETCERRSAGTAPDDGTPCQVLSTAGVSAGVARG